MFSPIRVKPKIIPQMFIQFRFARFKPNPPNGNSPKGSRLFELFKNRFRGAIVSEVNVHMPKHLKVPRLSMGLIEVDASWLPNKLVKVGLICRSNIDGKVLVAKSCVIDIHKLLPSYFSGIDNIEDDMLPPELCAASYSLITGVEFNLTCFDLVTDSQIVKKFLTDNPGNYFKRPTHGFLAICIKSMWFYTIGSGCGRVFWLRSKDNRVADVLSRCRHDHLRMGCGKYLKFVNYVKMDLHCFQLTFISKLGTGVFVTKGLGYNFLADRMLTFMEEALVDVNSNDQLCHGFRYYDSDNDGFVTLEELETAIWEFGVNDENFIRELMAELDDNLDGRITFRRLMAVVGLCTDSAMELDLHDLVTIIIMSYQLVILTSSEGGDGGNRPHDGVSLKDADIVAAHPLTRAKYLATPPLVAAYALAGTVDIEFEDEPIGTGKDGKSVYFREIWPSNEEIAQLLQVDEQKKAQVKLYAFGSRVALTDDDSDVVERSRKLFKDAAPTFMDDFDLWIFSEFSRSLVCKAYKGLIDAAALEFSSYDPLESIDKFPMDPSTGIRCAEVFLFFAVDGDVPGDLSNREAMVEFLNSLNSKNGIRKIHAFSVTAGSVVATREKLDELRGIHQSA